MTIDLSKEDINHFLHHKRINATAFKKIVAFFKKKPIIDFIDETIDLIKDALPCNFLEISYLKKAIGFNYLSLLMHDVLIETKTSDNQILEKNKLNILYGDLLIIESIYYINKVKNKSVRDFFFLKAKEIINAQFYLNINVFLKYSKENLNENYLKSLLKKNWLTFPIALLVFLEKKKISKKEKSEINRLINNFNFLYVYYEELLLLEKKKKSKLTSMHFYLRRNHLLVFNQMIKNKKVDIPQKIVSELKSNLQKKIKQISERVLNNKLSHKFFLEKFFKIKQKFLKKIVIKI